MTTISSDGATLTISGGSDYVRNTDLTYTYTDNANGGNSFSVTIPGLTIIQGVHDLSALSGWKPPAPSASVTITLTESVGIDQWAPAPGSAAWISGAGSLTEQGVSDALKLAPASGTPATGSVYQQLASIVPPSGAIAYTIQTNDTRGAPVPGVTVYAMSAESGGTIVAGPITTNSAGAGTLVFPTAGTAWIWQLCYGYATPAPQEEAITGATTITLGSLTKFAVPTGSGLCLRSDVEAIFGIPNLIKWANLSQGDPATTAAGEITDRINWAINSAFNGFSKLNAAGRLQLAAGWRRRRAVADEHGGRAPGYYLYSWLRQAQRGPDGKPSPDYFKQWFDWWQEQIDFVRAASCGLMGACSGRARTVRRSHIHASAGPTDRASADSAGRRCRDRSTARREGRQDMQVPSAMLRNAGAAINSVGQAIEDSQVEDGDPPYRITHAQNDLLDAAIAKCQEARKLLTTDGEADDYGEDPIGFGRTR